MPKWPAKSYPSSKISARTRRPQLSICLSIGEHLTSPTTLRSSRTQWTSKHWKWRFEVSTYCLRGRSARPMPWCKNSSMTSTSSGATANSLIRSAAWSTGTLKQWAVTLIDFSTSMVFWRRSSQLGSRMTWTLLPENSTKNHSIHKDKTKSELVQRATQAMNLESLIL